MKVYVDFDRTLFDSDKFLRDLHALINQYNIPDEVFKDCQNQCYDKGFNPYNILDLVKEKMTFDDKLYDDISKLLKRSKDYLFDDTILFLKYLKSLKYEIVILTKGNLFYQNEKIRNTGIDIYCNKIYVTLKHKGNLNIGYRNSIFIDDNPKEILSIASKKPKMIIRIRRDNSLYSDIPIDIDILSFKSLKELVDNKII
jgi:FMN phosphatase YigB (HAD superfamily)